MKVVGSGILEGISTRNDGSIKLIIGTQELDSTDAARLFELRNKFIKYLLSDSNIDPASEALIDDLHLKDGKKSKTPAQRLRAVLFRVFEQEGGKEENYDDWYKERMEEIINHYKKKLNE